METLEQEIIEKRIVFVRQKYSSLETGMYVNGEILKFREINLFDEHINLLIPESFIEMPIRFQVIRYPSIYRPKVILTSLDMNVNLGLTLFEKKADKEELTETINSVKNVIKRGYPDYRFFEMKKELAKNNPYCWFDFRSYALDDSVYNIYFVVLADNKILQGNFNCLYRDAEEWKKTALQMIENIKWIKGEQE